MPEYLLEFMWRDHFKDESAYEAILEHIKLYQRYLLEDEENE